MIPDKKKASIPRRGPCRFVGILLVGVLLSCLVRCSGPRPERGRTVVDDLGRRVSIPSSVDRVISLEPEITRLIVALGAGETLVGIDYFLKHHDHVFPVVFPGLKDLPLVSNAGQELDFETALALRPDLVFSSPSESLMTESIEGKLRAPVVALASLGRFENLAREIELLGDILGRQARARELMTLFEDRIESVREIIASGPQGPRPRAYLAFWGSLLKTPVSYDPVEAAGGINVAAGLLPSRLGSATAVVDIERLFAWDPDVVLVHGNYPPPERTVTVEGLLADPRLRSLRAVREGRVHYTFGFWYWWDPALVLLEIQHLARILHPNLFPTFDLEAEGDLLFEAFYGISGAFSEISRILGCDDW